MKNLVVVFPQRIPSGKPFGFDKDPQMYDVFYHLFDLFLENGLNIYVCRDVNNIISNNEFLTLAKYYKNDHFMLKDEKVLADIVWDRTDIYSFPLPANKLDVDLLNIMEFKLISEDKWLSYLYFQKYCPKTVLISDFNQLDDYLGRIPSSKFVVKPTTSFGGNGVECFNKTEKNLLQKYLEERNAKVGQYIIQEFCDVSTGIPGIVEGIHDMRIISTNGKIIFAYIRKPSKSNEFRSNFSIGGTMQEVLIEEIPSEIVHFVEPIIEDAYKNYCNPFFSIDLFMTKSGPRVIEITGAAVGLPTPNMKLESFYKELVKRFVE